jgi:hypothetical protein
MAGLSDPTVNAGILLSWTDENYDQNLNYGILLCATVGALKGSVGVTLAASTSDYLVSYGSHWREFEQGEYVNYDTIFGDYNDYFFVSDNKGGWRNSNLSIAAGKSAYLGFSVNGNSPYAYGWVQLGFDGISVYVVNSAFSIGDPIQVGLVPEPAAVGLLFAGGVALLLRRKRRKALRNGG